MNIGIVVDIVGDYFMILYFFLMFYTRGHSLMTLALLVFLEAQLVFKVLLNFSLMIIFTLLTAATQRNQRSS